MSYKNPWLYNGVPFESSMIGQNTGFVYLLKNKQNGKMYIGRKYFFIRRGNEESNWKEYYSSSKIVNKIVMDVGIEAFERVILSLHESDDQTNYEETKCQFKFNVLEAIDNDGERLFYNQNIAGRYFCPLDRTVPYDRTELIRDKIRNTLLEKNIKPKNCSNPKSEETKQKLRDIAKERGIWTTNNPNASDKWQYTIQTLDGIVEISNFKQWFIEQGHTQKDYSALVVWSKKQNKREFGEKAKVKKTELHKKFNMKILGYKTPKGTYVEF